MWSLSTTSGSMVMVECKLKARRVASLLRNLRQHSPSIFNIIISLQCPVCTSRISLEILTEMQSRVPRSIAFTGVAHKKDPFA